MAPRTRSNRAEKLTKERLLAMGITLNSRGFPALPNDLFLEILSYFPAAPIPQLVWFKEETNPHRQVTLLSLSQTCRALRSFFLPYAWERIEVFGGMWSPAGRLVAREEQRYRSYDIQKIFDVKFVEELLRQLETVTVRNPDLGRWVRIVNVILVNLVHKDTVLPKFAQSLSLLPNVHTLQLVSPYGCMMDFFSEYTYPSIHTLCLHGYFTYENILQACPNVRSFKSGGTVPLRRLLETCASQIEVLGVLSTSNQQISPEEIVSGFPRLRDVLLDYHLVRKYEDDLSCLSSLPLLTICLYLVEFVSYFHISLPTSAERIKWIELARKILEKCPTRKGDVKKRVVIVNEDKSVETRPVIS